jgi:phosphoserine phosphatase RsbU/P
MIPGVGVPGGPTPPARGFWRSLFPQEAAAPVATGPLRCAVPRLREAEIAALYYDRRMGGDFYEFLRVGPSRVLFALLDMAGQRDETSQTLRAAQSTFRILGPRLFGGEDFNEATAMMKLCGEMNRTILEGGVRNCPAFIGCYNEDLGTVCYASAGHTPALVRDHGGMATLEATGLPLGLFTHTTQSAATCALAPGAALLTVSRGIVEAEYAGEEFGLDRTMTAFERAGALSAHGLCMDVLQAIQNFTRTPPLHNDVTALVLARMASRENL